MYTYIYINYFNNGSSNIFKDSENTIMIDVLCVLGGGGGQNMLKHCWAALRAQLKPRHHLPGQSRNLYRPRRRFYAARPKGKGVIREPKPQKRE